MWTFKALLLANLSQADAFQRYYHDGIQRGYDNQYQNRENYMLSQKKVKDFNEYKEEVKRLADLETEPAESSISDSLSTTERSSS